MACHWRTDSLTTQHSPLGMTTWESETALIWAALDKRQVDPLEHSKIESWQLMNWVGLLLPIGFGKVFSKRLWKIKGLQQTGYWARKKSTYWNQTGNPEIKRTLVEIFKTSVLLQYPMTSVWAQSRFLKKCGCDINGLHRYYLAAYSFLDGQRIAIKHDFLMCRIFFNVPASNSNGCAEKPENMWAVSTKGLAIKTWNQGLEIKMALSLPMVSRQPLHSA